MFNRRQLNITVLVLCIVMLFASFVLAEDFKVNLNLFERLVLMGVLPQSGDFATLKIVVELNLMLGATDEEFVAAGLEPQPDGSTIARKGWDAVPEKEFAFKEAALSIIKGALQKLNDTKRLTMQQFRVYEKFMIVKEEK